MGIVSVVEIPANKSRTAARRLATQCYRVAFRAGTCISHLQRVAVRRCTFDL